MKKKLSPLIKGLITGIAMIIVASVLYYSNTSTATGLQNVALILFALGIFWTLFDYSRSEEYTGKFGDIFSQGFKCFIIVTLVMVVYIIAFTKTHPEMELEYAKAYREYLMENQPKDRTPAEIEEQVAKAKSNYTTTFVSGAIFQNLLLGAVFTAAGAGILLLRRKQ